MFHVEHKKYLTCVCASYIMGPHSSKQAYRNMDTARLKLTNAIDPDYFFSYQLSQKGPSGRWFIECDSVDGVEPLHLARSFTKVRYFATLDAAFKALLEARVPVCEPGRIKIRRYSA